jgi:hypothetical protein
VNGDKREERSAVIREAIEREMGRRERKVAKRRR